MSRQITPRTTLDNLKREAKRWLKALRANVAAAHARLASAFQNAPDANAPDAPTLRDVQHALALEHGLPGWSALKKMLRGEGDDDDATRSVQYYERAAADLLDAYRTGNPRALQSVWDHFSHRRPLEGMRRYVRVDLGYRENDDVDISLDEARFLVARAHGFPAWMALTSHLASLPPGKTTISARPVRIFSVDAKGARQPIAATRDWDAVLAMLEEQRIPGLSAEGEMTDALLERVSRLAHVTSLDLRDSKRLTDAGFAYLTRMPQLRELNLSSTAISDRGLEVLRHLPRLESIELVSTAVTDVGAAHLASCDNLRHVNLSLTHTGDGAIRALTGKPRLCDFESGNAVTDAGIALLHEFPVFKTWHGGEVAMWLTGAKARPNHLQLRGSLTNRGLAGLVGLDGLFALSLDDDRLAVTGPGLAPLIDLPHLGWLAFDATDDAMPYIASMPHLRFLLCQDTAAGDDGFVALSRSRSIEYIWGRRCYNLRSRGFAALSTMPALRSLSVSCKNVGDDGLSALPRFPALEELMPMDVPDEGYRHVGRCTELESLVLMYCRDTTDRATEHITRLPRLKKYFASYTQITDRTPEILSGVQSLEQVTLSECHRVTSAGIAALARLPRLREVHLAGMPKVTHEVVAAFPPGVRVEYSP
ncbi:MAG: hypothetical protein M3282_02195 [Gemmatimonadota bacterium]|nr:hypothetical protein [Gemmatimonadota bacterium]